MDHIFLSSGNLLITFVKQFSQIFVIIHKKFQNEILTDKALMKIIFHLKQKVQECASQYSAYIMVSVIFDVSLFSSNS